MKTFLIVVGCIVFAIGLVGLVIEAGREKTNPSTGCVEWTDFTHWGKIDLKPGMDCELYKQGDNTLNITCCPRKP